MAGDPGRIRGRGRRRLQEPPSPRGPSISPVRNEVSLGLSPSTIVRRFPGKHPPFVSLGAVSPVHSAVGDRTAAPASFAVAFLNRKGGVGKTSCCHHLAGCYAQAGRRVLLVDADPQASLT
jgi:Mrp family chromosome partitioning ATPase